MKDYIPIIIAKKYCFFIIEILSNTYYVYIQYFGIKKIQHFCNAVILY